MRDLTQAQVLDIDTSDMVEVTHPDKSGRYGGPARYTMTNIAFAKRGLAARGYEIVGRPNGNGSTSHRERALEAEVDRLRQQLDAVAVPEPGEGDKEALQQQAEALGVQFDRRWGPKKLQAAIDEAKAALADDEFGEGDE